MKKTPFIVCLVLCLFFEANLWADSGTSLVTFAQAVALYKALPATATATDKLAAVNAILSAPDLPADQQPYYLHEQAYALLFAGHQASEYAPIFLASYNGGFHDSFVPYLQSAIDAGGTLKSDALSAVPTFAAQPYAGLDGLECLALAAEQGSDPDSAFALWNNLITASPDWNQYRGTAIVHVGKLSKKRGDTARQTDLILIPLLTTVNVHVVDGYYSDAYDLVSRSTISINGSTPVLTTAELKAFLQGILNTVDLLDVNQKFLTKIQSQLAAAN